VKPILSFSKFTRIFEGSEPYDVLVQEFPEFSPSLTLLLSVLSTLSKRITNKSPEVLAGILDEIKSAPLDAKLAKIMESIDSLISEIDPSLDEKLKGKIKSIAAEIKKAVPILKSLIEDTKEINAEERLSDLIDEWCDRSKDAILTAASIKESRIFESIKIDPRNMKNVFSSDISALLSQANSVRDDIESASNNRDNPKLKSQLSTVKRKIDNIVSELETGSGEGTNWETLNRSQAKDRINFIEGSIKSIIDEYSEIIYKGTEYSEKSRESVLQLKELADYINKLITEILALEKEIEEEKRVESNIKEGDLDWSILQSGVIYGQRKGKWYQGSPGPNGVYFGPIDFRRFSELIKGDNKVYKIEGNKWFYSENQDIDNSSSEWKPVTSPDEIKTLNLALAYQLLKEKDWSLKNKKPIFDASGNYIPSEKESLTFLPSLEDLSKFDPIKYANELKRQYPDAYNKDGFQEKPGSEEGTGGSGGGEGGGSGDKNKGVSDKSGEISRAYLSKDLPKLKFSVKNSIFTNDNPARMWQKDGKPLTTSWFPPGSFRKADGAIPIEKMWIRLSSGYWEMAQPEDVKGTKPEEKDIIKLFDYSPTGDELKSFKATLKGLDNQLESIIKNVNDISKYWGIGSGKTNIKADAWGGEKEVQAVVRGKDTKDERIEVTIWPDKLGGSSVSDDVILKLYKNGGVGISDDDFSDNIWGEWGIENDGKTFFVKWNMYSDSDSSVNRGWKPVSTYSKGKIGKITKFTGPASGGLKPVLDQAMNRFISVFY
jgi:hypothetical protein